MNTNNENPGNFIAEPTKFHNQRYFSNYVDSSFKIITHANLLILKFLGNGYGRIEKNSADF